MGGGGELQYSKQMVEGICLDIVQRSIAELVLFIGVKSINQHLPVVYPTKKGGDVQ